MTALGQALLALAIGALSLAPPLALAVRLAGRASPAARWATVGVLWQVYLIGLFFVLMSCGCFRPGPALALTGVVAVWGCRRLWPSGGTGVLTADVGAGLRRLNQASRSRDAALFGAAAVTLALAVGRALLLPPVSWDGLINHLYVVGNWVQNAGFCDLQAPDAFGFFHRHYPANAQIFSAWLMLPFHGDLLVKFANFLPWAIGLAAVYGLGRTGVRCRPRDAALAALAVGFNPAVFGYLCTAYVDLYALANLLAGGLLLLAEAGGADDRRGPVGMAAAVPAASGGSAAAVDAGWALPVAALAFGVAFGTRYQAAPVAMVGLLAVGWRAWRRDPRRLAVAVLGFSVMALPWYGRNWLATGSPVWPIPVRIGGLAELPGSPAWDRFIDGLSRQVMPPGQAWWRREAGFLLRLGNPIGYGLGPGFLLACLGGLCGAYHGWRQGQRPFTAFAIAGAGVAVGLFLAPSFQVFRYAWPASTGRYLTFPYAVGIIGCLTVLGAVGRWSGLVGLALRFVIAVGLFAAIPGAWSSGRADLDALAAGLVPILAVIVPPLALPERLQMSRRLVAFSIVLLVGGWVALAVLPSVRAGWRAPGFARAWEPHPLRLPTDLDWSWADQPERPLRIAFTAGWNHFGDNWFWYPLLGRQLQNHVSFVPTTRDGSIVDATDPNRMAAGDDFATWRDRLERGGFDRLVCIQPLPIEAGWADAHPDEFEPLPNSAAMRVYRIRRRSGR